MFNRVGPRPIDGGSHTLEHWRAHWLTIERVALAIAERTRARRYRANSMAQ